MVSDDKLTEAIEWLRTNERCIPFDVGSTLFGVLNAAVLSEAAAQPPATVESTDGGLDSWLVLRMGTHERLAQFSDYDEAISFARKLYQSGMEVQVMTGYNAPDPVAADIQPRPCASLEEAEVIARGVAALNPWVVSLLAEYDRLKAIDAALGPVVEKWVWLDPDDLDDIAQATSVEWVKAVQELVRVAAVVVRGEPS